MEEVCGKIGICVIHLELKSGSRAGYLRLGLEVESEVYDYTISTQSTSVDTRVRLSTWDILKSTFQINLSFCQKLDKPM